MSNFKRNRSGKEIRQNMTELNRLAVKIEKSKRGQQCECVHKMYGNPAIDTIKENGVTKFRCHLCGKEINLSRQSIEELDHAFAVIDAQCDAAKILSHDKDQGIEAIIAYQKDTLRIKDALRRILQISNKKENRGNRDRGHSTISWA